MSYKLQMKPLALIYKRHEVKIRFSFIILW